MNVKSITSGLAFALICLLTPSHSFAQVTGAKKESVTLQDQKLQVKYKVDASQTEKNLTEMSLTLKKLYGIDAQFSKLKFQKSKIVALTLDIKNKNQMLHKSVENTDGIAAFEIIIKTAPQNNWEVSLENLPAATTTTTEVKTEAAQHINDFGKSMGTAGKELGKFGKTIGKEINSSSKDAFQSVKGDVRQARSDVKRWFEKDSKDSLSAPASTSTKKSSTTSTTTSTKSATPEVDFKKETTSSKKTTVQ